MSLGSSAEVTAGGFRVRFAFAFKFCEAGVCAITSNFCQRWVLEEGFSIVWNEIHFLR